MRSARITLVELLVIIGVLGTLAAFILPPAGSPPPLTDKDLHLDDWRPGPEHLAVPPEPLRVRGVDLAGVWTDQIGWLDMTIKPLADGRYSVSFLSHGRCAHGGSVQLERSAEYEDGMLLLHRPVRELTGATYERLFSVRVNDAIWLLPSVRVTEIQADTSELSYWGVLSRTAQQ